MAIESNSSRQVRFADFEFDCHSGDLRRDGTSLKLQPQPTKVLAVLIQHAGEIVSRQELAAEVWGSDTFVDFEQGLNYAIRQIRAVLKDNAERIPADVKSDVEAKLEALKSASKGGDVASLRRAMDEFNRAEP